MLLPYLGNTSELTAGKLAGTLKDSSGGLYFTDWRNSATHLGKEGGDASKAVEWLIVYQIPDKDSRLREKLKSRMSTANLVNKRPGSSTNTDANDFFGMVVVSFLEK